MVRFNFIVNNKMDNKENQKQDFDWAEYMNNEFCYKAKVTDVYDGDTITCNLDLGFYVDLHKQKIRLFGINAPEMRGSEKEKGKITRNWLRDKILDQNIKIYTIRNDNPRNEEEKGKYGRWLGILVFNGENLNKSMVDLGLANFKIY